ncbi:ceramide synthase 4-like isoform X2 [Eublepharis macularius]|uniref:Ceramide synthase 4-like isoform X2 n=1 Tax=Eublepharis macularius TaxID=481883 RepID=A0AA97JGZ7_EUBMA|nr:ceramide synthase 4-like isoform X2 [Eublepharis macularius]
MKDTEEIRYPQPRHLLLSIPFTALLLILRVVFQRTIALPLGRKMGLKEKVRKKVSPNAVLEAYYRTHQKQPKERDLIGLAKQCDLQPRQVERWFQSRLKQDQLSLTEKFCEASWMTTVTGTTSIIGLAILYEKSWFWNDRECWIGYPCQLTKVFVYVKWQRTSEISFILFAIMYLSVRIVIFPYKVLYNTYYYTTELIKPFFGYYFMNANLMVLQLLSIFWAFLIFKMMYKFLQFGTMKKDIRSDSEDNNSDEEETEQKEASTELCM